MARLLAGTFLLAASAGTAAAEVRALSLVNTHTQERATVVFKRDGVYDAQGLQELNRLLRDWRRNEVTRMDPALFDLVWEVYKRTGATQPINIVCGYRSPATNNMLRSRSRGVAKFSQHMLGKAMDFYLPGVDLATLRETGMKMQAGGVGFYPTSGSPFVHMDTGSVRAWPRMTREQLVRLFPDGKTAHLPSDGEPLPGYQQALAEVEARKAKGGGPVESSGSGGGLLAALFGGGSSSSASYAPAPGADEDEEAAPPPPRQVAEIRQGALPPGAAPKTVARPGEAPPGIAPTLAAPQDAGRKPVQMAALAVPLPQPAPAAPVPTTTARGSIVAMPLAPAAETPARAAAPANGQPLPSRYGPASEGLPPGWIQGPSGKPAGEAAAERPQAPAQPQQIAFTPGLKPVAAPLPNARPGAEPMETLALAQIAGRPLVAVAVSLPKPRPSGAMRVADAADPHAALSAFAGDGEDSVALGYAPTAAAQPAAPVEEMRLAALAPAPSAPIARSMMPLPAPAAPVADRTPRGKADRAAARPTGKADRADGDRLLDPSGRTEEEAFALLRHPDQNAVDALLTKPRMSLATGFVTAALDGPSLHGFSGPAVVSLPVILTK